MVPEPLCTTAIANNATTSKILNKRSQETPARLLGVCCAGVLGWRGGEAGAGEASPALCIWGGEEGRDAVTTRPPPRPAVWSWCAIPRGTGFFPPLPSPKVFLSSGEVRQNTPFFTPQIRPFSTFYEVLFLVVSLLLKLYLAPPWGRDCWVRQHPIKAAAAAAFAEGLSVGVTTAAQYSWWAQHWMDTPARLSSVSSSLQTLTWSSKLWLSKETLPGTFCPSSAMIYRRSTQQCWERQQFQLP